MRRGLLFLLVVLIATFMSGFGVAMLFRPRAQLISTVVPPTDFDVALPEGSTTITVSDPRMENEPLARFVVERRGNSITGLPEMQKKIAPRANLSLEDAEFFRHELAAVTSTSQSVWQRANQIRNWLAPQVNIGWRCPDLRPECPARLIYRCARVNRYCAAISRKFMSHSVKAWAWWRGPLGSA